MSIKLTLAAVILFDALVFSAFSRAADNDFAGAARAWVHYLRTTAPASDTTGLRGVIEQSAEPEGVGIRP